MQLRSLGNLKCTCMSLYSRRHEHLPLGCRSWCFRSVSLHLRWQWWRVSTGNRGTFWPVHKRVGAVCSNVFKSQWCWCHSREWQDICNRYGICNAQQWRNCTFLLLRAFNISQKNWAKYFLVTPAQLYLFFFVPYSWSFCQVSECTLPRCRSRRGGGELSLGEPIRTQSRWNWW